MLAGRLEAIRTHSEALPSAPLVIEVARRERSLGGGLIAGGVALRIFLWLVPSGLVTAAMLSFWSEKDPEGLESAARHFGIGSAAATAAEESLAHGDRSAVLALLVGLVALAWFTLGTVRALVLAYALARGLVLVVVLFYFAPQPGRSRGDLRSVRDRGDDARLTLRPQPPRNGRRIPERVALEATQRSDFSLTSVWALPLTRARRRP